MKQYADAPRMSESTANALIPLAEPDDDWGFDRDMYELEKVVDRIVAALGVTSEFPDERYVVCRRTLSSKFVPPARPDLDFDVSMPEWAEADFSTPPAPPAAVL